MWRGPVGSVDLEHSVLSDSLCLETKREKGGQRADKCEVQAKETEKQSRAEM